MDNRRSDVTNWFITFVTEIPKHQIPTNLSQLDKLEAVIDDHITPIFWAPQNSIEEMVENGEY